jgi:hypothetical protein
VSDKKVALSATAIVRQQPPCSHKLRARSASLNGDCLSASAILG